MFQMTFVQIAKFVWLTGTKKGKFSKKIFKLFLLRNHKEDEAETSHTCIGHSLLQTVCFLLRSDKNSGCYGNLKFPWTYNGKSGNRKSLLSQWG